MHIRIEELFLAPKNSASTKSYTNSVTYEKDFNMEQDRMVTDLLSMLSAHCSHGVPAGLEVPASAGILEQQTEHWLEFAVSIY